MFEAKKSRVYTTILSGTACVLLVACGTAMVSPLRIVAEGAKWEEVSRAGLFTSEGVVAARDGMIYATDITRPRPSSTIIPGARSIVTTHHPASPPSSWSQAEWRMGSMWTETGT
jgi:hypothetical protein